MEGTKTYGTFWKKGEKKKFIFSKSKKSSKDVKAYLIFTKKGEMEEDFNWLCISRHYHKFSNTSVKSFGCLIGTSFELLVVVCLLDQVLDGDGELCVGERVCFWVRLYAKKVSYKNERDKGGIIIIKYFFLRI